MKKTLLILLLTSPLLIGCKFDTSPAMVIGEYTGTYEGGSLPVNSGNGTCTITQNGANKVDILFTSSGNPDYYMTDLAIGRFAYGGTSFLTLDMETPFDPNLYYSANVTPMVEYTHMRCSYFDSTGVDFEFVGTK